jgi:hypothetical protein
MDSRDFDRIARVVGSGQSRRRVVKTLAGGALGAFATAVGLDHASAAARCRGQGVVCSKNADCCSSACLPKDRTGRRYCAECGSDNDCPGSTDPCQSATCTANVCGFTVNVGAICNDGDVCTTGDVCQADGSCLGTAIACSVPNACYTSTCQSDTGACSDATYDGSCTAECAASTAGCGTYVSGCNGNPGCKCITAADGPTCVVISSGFCASCTTNGDCGSGFACVTSATCCDGTACQQLCSASQSSSIASVQSTGANPDHP